MSSRWSHRRGRGRSPAAVSPPQTQDPSPVPALTTSKGPPPAAGLLSGAPLLPAHLPSYGRCSPEHLSPPQWCWAAVCSSSSSGSYPSDMAQLNQSHRVPYPSSQALLPSALGPRLSFPSCFLMALHHCCPFGDLPDPSSGQRHPSQCGQAGRSLDNWEAACLHSSRP